MKKLLVGLLVVGSISSYAACGISISQWGVNGEHLSDRYVARQINLALASKGYTVANYKNSELNAHLHYYGMISENGRSKTVGTVLTVTESDSGYKITDSKSERFIGTSRGISKRTLKRNLEEIVKEIPRCI